MKPPANRNKQKVGFPILISKYGQKFEIAALREIRFCHFQNRSTEQGAQLLSNTYRECYAIRSPLSSMLKNPPIPHTYSPGKVGFG